MADHSSVQQDSSLSIFRKLLHKNLSENELTLFRKLKRLIPELEICGEAVYFRELHIIYIGINEEIESSSKLELSVYLAYTRLTQKRRSYLERIYENANEIDKILDDWSKKDDENNLIRKVCEDLIYTLPRFREIKECNHIRDIEETRLILKYAKLICEVHEQNFTLISPKRLMNYIASLISIQEALLHALGNQFYNHLCISCKRTNFPNEMDWINAFDSMINDIVVRMKKNRLNVKINADLLISNHCKMLSVIANEIKRCKKEW